MQELQRLINIYHIAFIVCLVLAIVFLVISIILFFRFDIRSIFDMKSGRGAKRAIQKMQELNDQTGKLRDITETPVMLNPEDRVQHPTKKTVPEGNASAKAGDTKQSPAGKRQEQPAPPKLKTRPDPKPQPAPKETPYAEAIGETAPLGRSAAASAPNTAVDPAGAGTPKAGGIIPGQEETSILTPDMNTTVPGMEETAVLSQEQLNTPPQAARRFVIEKQLMWIHTDEEL